LPHHYRVSANASPETDVELTSHGLTPLMTAAAPEFGGPGYRWSPETLLVGAVADCFILTFRSIAKASQLNWKGMVCEGTGKLDRIGGITCFTSIELDVTVTVPGETEIQRVRALLAKVEKACFIGNSLRFEVIVHANVVTESPAEALSLT
jgi:organic hydroperoxide reductase OsmC/OhrA